LFQQKAQLSLEKADLNMSEGSARLPVAERKRSPRRDYSFINATLGLLSNATINASIIDATRDYLARRYIVLIINKLQPV